MDVTWLSFVLIHDLLINNDKFLFTFYCISVADLNITFDVTVGTFRLFKVYSLLDLCRRLSLFFFYKINLIFFLLLA